jgi:hypothetical protein
MVGSVELSVIVPVALKVIVSVPDPAAQSPLVESVSLFAFVIASRRVQLPSPAVVVSRRELAVRLAADAERIGGAWKLRISPVVDTKTTKINGKIVERMLNELIILSPVGSECALLSLKL